MVSTYFDRNDCAAALPDHRAEAIISLLSDRFMALNPPTPFAARTFDTTGFQADTKGFYHFDFDQRFPTARVGDAAAAIGELFAPQARDSGFVLRAHCPTKVLLNSECVFTTSGQEERSGCDCRFRVRLKQGLNRFVVIAECTSIGFSCMLGNAMPQWEPCCFLMPFSQRNGEAGWVYRLFIKGTDVPSDI